MMTHWATLKRARNVAHALPKGQHVKRLTNRTLQALKRAEKGKRYDVTDSEARGLGVRVNDQGRRAFVFVSRFPGSKNPVRRHLGDYPAMSLSEARTKARAWRDQLLQGKDPRVEQER